VDDAAVGLHVGAGVLAVAETTRNVEVPEVRSWKARGVIGVVIPLAATNGALKNSSNRRLKGKKVVKLPTYPSPPNGLFRSCW
jgi:hypothetical protein